MTPVRFPRLSTQGYVFGLEVPALLTLLVAVAIAAMAVMREGLLGLLIASPFWGLLAGTSFARVRGVPLVRVIGRELLWLVRRAAGTTRFRVRPEEVEMVGKAIKTPAGPVLKLPGAESRFELLESASGPVVVYDAAAQTMTISAIVATDGHFGLSDEEREAFLAAWSRVQGMWTLRAGITRVTITEQTTAGSAVGAEAYYAEHAGAFAGAAAGDLDASYRQVLAAAESMGVAHRTQVALTFDLGVLGRDVKHHGGGRTGVLGLAALEMSSAEDALRKCGFTRVRWQSAREWVAWGRQTLDPDYQSVIDLRSTGDAGLIGVDPAAGTPTAIDEYRDKVVVDSGYHRTFWIHQFPRLEVLPGFLEHVVFSWLPNGDPVRHTMQLVLNPVPVGKALRNIDQAKKTWLANADIRAKAGRLESAADRADWANLVAQEEAIVSGHGEYRYSAYVTVHAVSPEALEIASATMRNALGRSGLEPQVLYCQQAAALMMCAFPAGLGMR